MTRKTKKKIKKIIWNFLQEFFEVFGSDKKAKKLQKLILPA